MQSISDIIKLEMPDIVICAERLTAPPVTGYYPRILSEPQIPDIVICAERLTAPPVTSYYPRIGIIRAPDTGHCHLC
jgi:hypothetical protein